MVFEDAESSPSDAAISRDWLLAKLLNVIQNYVYDVSIHQKDRDSSVLPLPHPGLMAQERPLFAKTPPPPQPPPPSQGGSSGPPPGPQHRSGCKSQSGTARITARDPRHHTGRIDLVHKCTHSCWHSTRCQLDMKCKNHSRRSACTRRCDKDCNSGPPRFPPSSTPFLVDTRPYCNLHH